MNSAVIWTTLSRQRGTQMAGHSRLVTKTRHAGSGISETFPSPLLFWVAIWEPYGRFATHRMGDSWQWRNQQISFIYSTSEAGTEGSRWWISLVRFLAFRSVPTPRLCSSVFMIGPIAASSSTTGYGSTHTLILLSEFATCNHWQSNVSSESQKIVEASKVVEKM